jgi:hypothetical protein
VNFLLIENIIIFVATKVEFMMDSRENQLHDFIIHTSGMNLVSLVKVEDGESLYITGRLTDHSGHGRYISHLYLKIIKKCTDFAIFFSCICLHSDQLLEKFGPIESWWFEQTEKFEELQVGITVNANHYHLQQPQEVYAGHIMDLKQKGKLAYIVFDFLAENEDCSIMQMLHRLQKDGVPVDGILNEDVGRFIIDHIFKNVDDFSFDVETSCAMQGFMALVFGEGTLIKYIIN